MATDDGGVPLEEIRFAVVLNGGVSLAVWMGGAVLELDRLTRARDENGSAVYRHLLSMVGGTARADVISGTSAGGINGAALALSQVNRKARLSQLRDLWAEQGRMEQLLRTPFQGHPVSLLKGDEFFLPRLEEALGRLVAEVDLTDANKRPIDLCITTTLLQGVPQVTVDELGQPLVQYNHQCTFSFRRDPDVGTGPGRDDFAEADLRDRASHLAVAARSSASFPFAFEPSYVPVNSTKPDMRPDMAQFASWSDGGADRSRYAVDGGVLVNTPTKQALEAIDRMPAGGPVRRVMVLLFPHAEAPGNQPVAADPAVLPTTLGTGSKLLEALRSQGARTFVEKIEEHNRLAASRRGSREELLDRLAADAGPVTLARRLYGLSEALYPHYKDVKVRRAARDLTNRQLRVPGANADRWSYERIRAAAECAQRAWLTVGGGLPYAPAVGPPAVRDDVGPENRGWRWGFSMAEALTSSVMGLLERLVHVVPKDSDAAYDQVCRARERVHEARFAIKREREEFDRQWADDVSVTLSAGYWSNRLEKFNASMVGAEAASGVAVRREIDKVAEAVQLAAPVLRELDPAKLCDVGLSAWALLFDDMPTFGELRSIGYTGRRGPWLKEIRATTDEHRRQVWLSRLLALEIATTCLADEADTGFDQPVELVQISLQTKNPFAVYSTTPDDKAGGASLARFGGFLKRSWRVNDWIWGRIDGATMLCRLLLSQSRLRRVAVLEGKMATGPELDRRVDEELRGLLGVLFGVDDPDQVPFETRAVVAKAEQELRRVYDSAVPVDHLEQTSTAIAELAAWGLHARAAVEELPHLRSAIIADQTDGSDPRSHGVRFIEEHESMLADLGRPGLDPDDPRVASEKGIPALMAFDRAGIGREPLGQEASSDQAIRTAATATAVAVTIAGSDNSGLRSVKALRPIVRVLRGAGLLPYWAIVGLTRGGNLARYLGVLGLAGGGLLLALALVGVLSNGAGSVAATIGGGTVLAAFGYAALRTQHVMHGLVLLSPIVPLVLLGIQWSPADREELPAVSAVAAIAFMVVGLAIIGSLPAPLRSPLDALARWRGTGTDIHRAGTLLACLGAVALLATWVAAWKSGELVVAWTASVIVATLASATTVAAHWGKSLQRWRQGRNDAWELERVTYPAATTAGWGVVYGTFYAALAGVLLLTEPGVQATGAFFDRWRSAPWWSQGSLITAVVLAVVLLLLTPWLIPWRARAAITRRLVDRATRAAYVSAEETAERMLTLLEGRGMLYRFLTTCNGTSRPGLTATGWKTAERICERLWPPHPGATGKSSPKAAVTACLAALRRNGSPNQLYTSSSPTAAAAFEQSLSGLVDGIVAAEAPREGFTATAEVRVAANGQPSRCGTIHLVRHGRKWLIDTESAVRGQPSNVS